MASSDPTQSTGEHHDPWDSDHTSLVHVLWNASGEGHSFEKADELAQFIGNSRWMRAVIEHARRDGAIAERDHLRAEVEALKAERVTLRAAVRGWLDSPQPERNRLDGVRRVLNDAEYAKRVASGSCGDSSCPVCAPVASDEERRDA